jgi:CRISPR-associated endonuclease Cas3-HD
LLYPYGADGFNVQPSSVLRLAGFLPDRAAAAEQDEEPDELDLFQITATYDGPDWRLMVPETESESDESERAAGRVRWREARDKRDVLGNVLFVAHPALVQYSPATGLELGPGPNPVPLQHWSRPGAREARRRYQYASETYDAHIRNMLTLYERHEALWPTLAAVSPLVEAWLGWPAGLLDRLLRAAIVLHDAGKLTKAWQEKIKRYQEAYGNHYEPWLVHTDSQPPEREKQRGVYWNTPKLPHALSGAAHSWPVGLALGERAGVDRKVVARLLFTVIATHHQPVLSDATVTKDQQIPLDAANHLNDLCHQLLSSDVARVAPTDAYDRNLTGYLLPYRTISSDARAHLALAILIRTLRLADGWSQDEQIGKGYHLPTRDPS